jgi:predicted regulator of Ras-like GTPase activity (Roadblock/LC7/MglB family)
MLAAMAPGQALAADDTTGPVVAAVVAPERPAEAVAAGLRDALPGLAEALRLARSDNLESLLAICDQGAVGLATPAAGLGAAAVGLVMPGEVQLGVAAMQLKQVRRGLDELALPVADLPPVGLTAATMDDQPLPPVAQAASEAISGLLPRRGQGLVLVFPGTADAGQVAAAAELLWADWSSLAAVAGLGALGRLLVTGTAGGMVMGALGEGVLVALMAPTPSDVAKLQVQLRRLQTSANAGSDA